MRTEDLAMVLMAQETERLRQQAEKMKKQASYEQEVANQSQNKAEKVNLSNALTNNGEQQNNATNNSGSQGSILSRLKTARMVIGTPESDVGTGGDSLGTYFKKELVK